MTGDRQTAAYEDGFSYGQLKRADADYDARWDFADAAKAGTFASFKRGFTDGFEGKESNP